MAVDAVAVDTDTIRIAVPKVQGSQYANQIYNLLNDRPDVTARQYELDEFDPYAEDVDGVIMAGGGASAHDVLDTDEAVPEQFDFRNEDYPTFLGICLGHQVAAYYLGGKVERTSGQVGHDFPEVIEEESRLYDGVGGEPNKGAGRILKGGGEELPAYNAAMAYVPDDARVTPVVMSHNESVTVLPYDAEQTGTSYTTEGENVITSFTLNDRVFGVQYHPEVVHTPEGNTVLGNFVNIVREQSEQKQG